jgi:nucleoside-diphosphate-sugar epimerase
MTECINVLVTGATGFVGKALSNALRSSTKYRVVTASRSVAEVLNGVEHRRHELLDKDAIPDLADIDIIVHTASRVHMVKDQATDKLTAYRSLNVVGTIELAEKAAKSGVRRFIYLSSIKVNGELTTHGRPFTIDDLPAPQDPYGRSKYEAEIALRAIELKTNMEVVIIRPPLIYGPGVKANFLKLIEWSEKGIPLPFGAINNQRSLVSLKNLISLIDICINNNRAAGGTFLVSDDFDVSTTQLLNTVMECLGKNTFLFPISSRILVTTATVFGKGESARRLCDSLQINIAHTKKTLNWSPPTSFESSIRETCLDYLRNKLKSEYRK